jgi:hypothetical protein
MLAQAKTGSHSEVAGPESESQFIFGRWAWNFPEQAQLVIWKWYSIVADQHKYYVQKADILNFYNEKAARLLTHHGTTFFFACSTCIAPYSPLQR